MGDIIVLLVLGLMVGAAIARLRRQKKTGGCCGDCGNCGGCCQRQK